MEARDAESRSLGSTFTGSLTEYLMWVLSREDWLGVG